MTPDDIATIIDNFRDAVTSPEPVRPFVNGEAYQHLSMEYDRLHEERRNLIVSAGVEMELAYFAAMRKSVAEIATDPESSAAWSRVAANILAALDRWIALE
jgi:hypothetical protein